MERIFVFQVTVLRDLLHQITHFIKTNTFVLILLHLSANVLSTKGLKVGSYSIEGLGNVLIFKLLKNWLVFIHGVHFFLFALACYLMLITVL